MSDAALYVHRFGEPSGAPVVLLHGVTGHGARWRRTAERYLAHRNVVAPDLRGHGHSPHEPPWGAEQHVADVLAALDLEGIDRADLVGHSFGGMIAVHLARAAPDRVRSLVLLDPSIGLDPPGAREAAHGRLTVPTFADMAEARAALARRWPGATPEILDDEVDAHLAPAPDGRLRWRIDPAAIVTAFSEMARPHVLPPVHIPTHLVIATYGDYVRPEFVVDCRTALGQGLTITEIESGHMLYVDAEEETGALLSDWLAP